MDYENDNFFKRNLVWIIAVAALILFGVFFFNGWGEALNNSVGDKTVTITGSFSCLPDKGATATSTPSGPCELGLRSRDGLFYALDVSHIQDANINLKADDNIAVTGFMKPESAIKGSKWEKYNVAAIIQVNTLLGAR